MTTELVQAQPQALQQVGPQVLPSRTLKYLQIQAGIIAASPIAGPYRGKPDELLPILVRGAELGLQPTTSIDYLYTIENRVYPASKLVGALFRKAGHWFRVVEETPERCVIKARHRNDPPEDTLTVEFTVEQAKKLGVFDVTWKKWGTSSNGKKFAETWVEGSDEPRPAWAKAGVQDVQVTRAKDNWVKDTANMLYLRCLRRACERVDPGILMALGTEFVEDVAYVSPHASDPTVIDAEPESITPFTPPEDFQSDDEVVDGEVVTEDPWVTGWRVAIRENGFGPAESKAIIRFATDGLMDMAADIDDHDRPVAEEVLAAVVEGRYSFVDGKVTEEAAA